MTGAGGHQTAAAFCVIPVQRIITGYYFIFIGINLGLYRGHRSFRIGNLYTLSPGNAGQLFTCPVFDLSSGLTADQRQAAGLAALQPGDDIYIAVSCPGIHRFFIFPGIAGLLLQHKAAGAAVGDTAHRCLHAGLDVALFHFIFIGLLHTVHGENHLVQYRGVFRYIKTSVKRIAAPSSG